MQVKNAASETNAKLLAVLIHDSLTVPPMKTKTITAFDDHSSEWKTTGTETSVEKFTEAASLIIFYSFSTIFDEKREVRVTTESLYSILKTHKLREFLIVTPEQSKFIKPVDTANLSMIPESDPYLTIYLTELPKTNKPEQQNDTFWFPKSDNLGILRIIPQCR